jgi:hypothetical protein
MNGWPQSEQASSALPRACARFSPVILSIAVVLSLGTADASSSQAVAASSSSAEAGFWGEVAPARREYRPSRSARLSRTSNTRQHRLPQAEHAPTQPQRQTLRRPVPYGSSGYVAPAALPQAGLSSPPPIVQPYQPPPTTTFSDRVNNAIQAYPLEKGIGNNPVNQQEFIRQRANSP